METPEEIIEDTTQPPSSESIRSRSPCLSALSTLSDTSTIGYSQEAWDEFKPRVEKLCKTLWPATQTFGHHLATRLRAYKFFRPFIPQPQAPLIERLRGGDRNRITGISLPASDGTRARNLILRHSRWDEGRSDREAATLSYVRRKTSIPVPEIIAKDFSCDNPLGKPYVIQLRIPGSDLNSM